MCFFFFLKKKTAYEMRISDWSSDVCSSDLGRAESPTDVQAQGGDREHRRSLPVQTCDDGSHDGGGFRNVAHSHRIEANFSGGIVIPTGEDRIADEQHPVERDAAFSTQAPQAIALVHPCPGARKSTRLNSSH